MTVGLVAFEYNYKNQKIYSNHKNRIQMRKKNRIHFNYSTKAVTNSFHEIRELLLKYFFRRRLLSLILLLTTGLTGLQAQSLFVRENSGSQLSFALNEIRSITFPQSKVEINKADGSTSTYSFAEVQYLSFSDFTTDVNFIADSKQTGLQLYPNPVSNRLHITFKSEKGENVQLSIINLQGKVLQQQNMACHEGANIAEMSVAGLKQGIYLFRFQNREKNETIKFLKN